MPQNFDLKEEIRAFWSARSVDFDDSAAHKIEDTYGTPQWQAFVRQALGLGPGQTADGLDILDLACGTGEISRILCSLGANVTGLDFSEAMLARASAKLKGQSWTPVLGDAERLIAFNDQSFDFATTRHLAWTLTDPDAAYGEWFRVLRPGGRLLINDGDWAKPLSLPYRIRRAIADLLDPAAQMDADVRAAHSAIFERLPYREGLTVDTLTKAMEAAGFARIAELDPRSLYGRGMRAHGLAERLRQSSENRFSLLFERAH